MAGNRTLKLNILAETKGLTDGLNKANQQVSGASNGLSNAFNKVKLAAIAATAAGAAFAVKYGKDAILAASNLSETIAKAGQIFGSTSRQVEAFAATAASSLGQSKQQALDAATTFAVFGKSAGLAGDDLVKFSTDFTVLASNLASFNNTTPDEAITAIGAALRGEAEPLRRFGVLLDDATLRATALELGIVSTTKNALTPQQKVLAAQEVIFRQTADAQGDFARTSDGLANSQRILAAQLDNVKTTIGTALLPIATDLFASFSQRLIPAVESFAATFRDDLVPYIERRVLPAFADLKDAIFGVGDAFKSTNTDARESRYVIQLLRETIVEFVPTTVGSLTIVANVWATFVDILRRGVAFIQGDLQTATREFNNRFAETNTITNNVSQSTVNAYKQFQFFSKVTKDEVIPATTLLTTKTNALTTSNNALAGSTRAVTAAMKEQFTAAQAIDLIRSGFGSEVGATSTGALAGGESVRSAAEIVSQFGGFIKGFNFAPTDPYFGFGKGSNIRTFQAGQGAVQAGNVVINVNGTVIDPEGAARAIASVISNSVARVGSLPFVPALAFE